MIRYMTSYHKDGIDEGIRRVAKKLLEMGKVSLKDLQEATDLSQEELEHLVSNG